MPTFTRPAYETADSMISKTAAPPRRSSLTTDKIMSFSCFEPGKLPPKAHNNSTSSSRRSSVVQNIIPDTPQSKYFAKPPDNGWKYLQNDYITRNALDIGARPLVYTRRNSVATSDRRTIAEEKRGLENMRFAVVSAPTVLTKRNFSLLRDTSVGNVQSLLQSATPADTKTEANGRRNSEPVGVMERAIFPTQIQAKTLLEEAAKLADPVPTPYGLHRSKSVTISHTIGDRSCSKWEWPLPTKPKITSTDDTFEVEFDVWPYSTNDIWARVMGSELIIHFRQDDDDAKPRPHGKLRPLFRTYQLPINVDTNSVKFRFKRTHIFILTALKVPPIHLAVACYIDGLDTLATNEEVSSASDVVSKQTDSSPSPVSELSSTHLSSDSE